MHKRQAERPMYNKNPLEKHLSERTIQNIHFKHLRYLFQETSEDDMTQCDKKRRKCLHKMSR